MIQALFCDDMRRDEQGTFILVGVYPGIIFLEKSVEKSVGNYIQVSALPVGDHKMRLRVIFEPEGGGKTLILAKQSTSVSIEKTSMPFVVTPTGLRLALETNGVIRLFIGIDEEDDQEVTSLKVKIEDDSSEEEVEEVEG